MKITSWRKVPLCLIGYDIRRWEQPGGISLLFDSFAKRLLIWQVINTPTIDGEYAFCGPTHLQYDSPFGFLLTWPLCLHVWYQFKGQDTYVDGNGVTMTKPGTEKVLYWRCGARWDAHDGFYETPSWYGGLHWD